MGNERIELRPLAVAIMVLLRGGSQDVAKLSRTLLINGTEAAVLMADLAGLDLVRRYGNSERWGLTFDGLGWLQTHGLDATAEAKAALCALGEAVRK